VAVPSRDVINLRFGRFIKNALNDCRSRGMTDEDIENATGVTYGTFHRWARGQLGRTGPQITKVRKFCEGTGASYAQALALLGLSGDDTAAVAPPEPQIPADVRELLRRLNDPNVPAGEKIFIRETFRSLVARPKLPAGGPQDRGRRR
jgi:transcriptional regulator with XRE-family HTH domain